jgi:hypothetical protein
MSSTWAKTYVENHIEQTKGGKGYRLPMPDLVAYPDGAVPLMIGKPVDANGAPLLVQELLYEFNREVSKRTGSGKSKGRMADGLIKDFNPIDMPAFPA